MVEFLVNPREMKFAVRTAVKGSRHAVACSRVSNRIYYPLVWKKLYEKNFGTSDVLDVDVDLPDDEVDEAETVEE